MDKYYNDLQDSCGKISIGVSEKGKLLRLYFPQKDYFEFIDNFDIGVKINNSQMIFLSDDINNVYKTRYLENSNIIEVITTNTYFNISFIQKIFVSNIEDVVVIDFEIVNMSKNDYDIKLYVNSKLNTSKNNIMSSKVFENGVEQYNHEYILSILSNNKMTSHRLNDIEQNIKNCNIYDKDICGMSENVCICYDLGRIEPNKVYPFSLYLLLMEKVNQRNFETKLNKCLKFNSKKLFHERQKYDKIFLDKFDSLKIDLKKLKAKYSNDEEAWKYDYIERIYNIYIRSIFLLNNLQDKKTGAIIAGMEVDEKRQKSGMYNFVWPRDSVFVTKALDDLKMFSEVELFYSNFVKNAQNRDGSFEQRYFCDGTLAPCWGYQIDETASIVYGVYDHYKATKDLNFLEDNLNVCKKAIDFLKKYVDDFEGVILHGSERKLSLSYDLWEMHEGYSLYSFACVYAGFKSYLKIMQCIEKGQKKAKKKTQEKETEEKKEIEGYLQTLDNIFEKFVNDKYYVRNLEDKQIDMSVVGLCYPFEIVDVNDKVMQNTIEKIDMELRTYTNGYKRFVGDSYLNGIPWPICNMFLANYYLMKKDYEKAKQLFDFVVYSCSSNYMLAEQIDNATMKPVWVIGLGWSHAMFVTTLLKLLKVKAIELK